VLSQWKQEFLAPLPIEFENQASTNNREEQIAELERRVD